ncbi:universal stress protein [Dermatophilaceae bacterium Sec6.4]
MVSPEAPTNTPTTPSTGRIVVGVDGSEPSKQALRWAAFVASTTGSSIDAVATWRLNGFTAGPRLMDNPASFDRSGEVAKMLDETIAEVFADTPPAALNRVVQEGNAATVLVEASRDAGMLIVGSRGRGGFVGLMLGSVSTACSAHSKCPVMVIHGDTPAPPAH